MPRPHLSAEVMSYDDHFGRVGKILADELATEFDNCDAREIDRVVEALFTVPIPMVLFCPECGTQHIDEAEEERVEHLHEGDQHVGDVIVGWDNPPHLSHKCHACSYIWRPADVPTTGVLEVQKRGSGDSAVPPHQIRDKLAAHQRERERLLNTHSIKIDNHIEPEALAKIKQAFETVHLSQDGLTTMILPHAEGISALTEKAAAIGAQKEQEFNRIINHARAIRVADILRDLRNTVMEISFFRMRKTDVLAEIDAARMQVNRVNEGTER